MSTNAEAPQLLLDAYGKLTAEEGQALDALLAEVEQLRAALERMREVAAVANEGDPWYCENEGIDVSAAFALAREALAREALGKEVRG